MSDTTTLHPDGFYDARIIETRLERNENTGSTCVNVSFQTEVGVVYGRLWLTEKAKEHTAKKLRAAGFANGNILDLNEKENRLIGNRCTILVKHESNNKNGKIYATADIWVERQRQDTSEFEDLKDFNVLLRDKNASDVEIPDDEEVPF